MQVAIEQVARVVVLASADRTRQHQWLAYGIRVTFCAAESNQLRNVLLTERADWLMIFGDVSDDKQIHSAIADVRRAGLATKVIVLGPEGDFGRCERWVRYGVACYLASSSSDERVIQALHLSAKLNLVVVDACFQERLTEIVRVLEPEPSLSQRELQLLKLVAAGLRTDEISTDLHLTGHTVEFHLRNIISKLGARNRTQAVSRAIVLGLVTSAECVGASFPSS